MVGLTFGRLAHGQQKPGAAEKGAIIGSVFDVETKGPIEFADVILVSRQDSSLVGGSVSDKSGKFTLTGIKAGSYSLRIQILGYDIKAISSVLLSESHPQLNLGKIYLRPSAIKLPDVVTEGTPWSMTYQLDKKVIDVSQMKTASAGSAADVLANVPSVNVDIDGNVSLRGSSNFQVLIDGRPSVMSAQDALQQIPASSIKNIEISTNPTAKYDASGDAGIINIILKKNSNLGWSGMVNVTGGLDDKYGANYIVQYKTPLLGYNIGLDFNRRSFPGTNRQEKQFILGSNTSYLNSDGTMLWQRILSGLRGGLDINVSEDDNLTLGGGYGTRAFHRLATLNYDQWSVVDPQQLNYLDNTNHDHYGNYYELNANYLHKFDAGGHELTGNASYRHNGSDESSVSTATQEASLLNGTQTTEQGPQNELRGNIDYTLPINGSEKFSAGSEFFSRIYQDINKLYVYDTATTAFQFQGPFSHNNNFNRTRFAAYSMFSDRWDSLQVQLGFRTEYTYQLVEQADTNQRFAFSRWDYFPSIHSSYSLAGGTQIMASYARRINRPDGGDLEPFYSWFDANNVHIGNPALRPELIDSYDIGVQIFVGPVSLTNDVYYRFTHDKLKDIFLVYADNVTLRTVANVGTDQSLGYEFGVLFNPIKMWQFNLMGDLYDYRISGAIQNVPFANESLDWDIKSNNTFTISPSTQIQLDTRYFSPSVTAQGKWGGYFTTDLAVRQDIWGKNLSLTVQANDVFNTGRREFTSEGVGFYNYNYYYRRAPVVLLNLKYNFNNFKEDKKPGNNQDENGNS